MYFYGTIHTRCQETQRSAIVIVITTVDTQESLPVEGQPPACQQVQRRGSLVSKFEQVGGRSQGVP